MKETDSLSSRAEYLSYSENDTHAIAASLATLCRAGDCICLEGDLGAGKTSFSRGFIRSLCAPDTEVLSPTFTLLQTYPMDNRPTLWHFDLYRLEAPEELVELGLDEALQSGITLIEWPAIAAQSLPAEALHVSIRTEGNGTHRHFIFAGMACEWESRIKTIIQNCKE